MSPTSVLPSAWSTPKPHVVCSPARSAQGLSANRAPAHQRFVAGDTFFNYDAFGSLRPLEQPIHLWDGSYIGLAVHATLCGFVFYFFSAPYGELLAGYLGATDDTHVKAAEYVLAWPQALSIFIGFVSDAYPLFGYRRKSYMIFGMVISVAAYVVLAVVDTYGHSSDLLHSQVSPSSALTEKSRYPIVYLVASLTASIGIQISWVSSLILGVEYAQRENLLHRGTLVAMLVWLFYVGGLVAFTVSALMRSSKAAGAVINISIGAAAGMLAVVSSTVIPFVIWGLKEEPFESLLAVGSIQYLSIRERISQFWRFCHHNFVYRVLFFIDLYLFLASVYDQDVKDAVLFWSGVTTSDADIVQAAGMVAQVVGTLGYCIYLRNVSWRKLAFWGALFFLALRAMLTICVVLDIVRNKWFYGAVIVLADIPRSWIVLYGVILATEIAEVGHEGVIFALGFSFQALAGISSSTLATNIPGAFGLRVSNEDIALDKASARMDLLTASGIILVINLSSLALVRLLPQQKLDAQQMRAFGGYNKCAGTALIITFVVMLLSNLVANVAGVL